MLAVIDVTQMSQHTCYLTHTIRLNSWIRLTLSHQCQSRLTVQLQIWATLKPHSHCYLKISPLILVWFGTNFKFCSDFLSWGKNQNVGTKFFKTCFIYYYYFFPLSPVSICSCFLVCVKYNMALRDLQIIVLFFFLWVFFFQLELLL